MSIVVCKLPNLWYNRGTEHFAGHRPAFLLEDKKSRWYIECRFPAGTAWYRNMAWTRLERQFRISWRNGTAAMDGQLCVQELIKRGNG